MKKNILFVMDSLVCAGGEKSLITLLSLIDYSKYSVDLQLFAYGRTLEKMLPKEVNLLPALEYTNFAQLSIKKSILEGLKNKKLRMLRSRINYSLKIRRKKYTHAQKAGIYWRNVSNVIPIFDKKYDIAISYAQGIPTFYVADKINSTKKFAWVNVGYRLDNYEQVFQKEKYNKYNKIVTVSNVSKEIFLDTFPSFKDRVEVIYDINNPKIINEMSNLTNGYDDDFDGIRLLTIGRLSYQKGYDIALDTCKKLKEKGIKFRWYVLGVGTLKDEIESYMKKNMLDSEFKLLGITSNPYPYIKNCDIYVQPSRYEGFGLAIAEARILNKPIVVTEFDSVYNQMINGKNGLVVNMNSDAVYKGILEFINNKELKDRVVAYLKKEKKGNVEEIEKFYELVE